MMVHWIHQPPEVVGSSRVELFYRNKILSVVQCEKLDKYIKVVVSSTNNRKLYIQVIASYCRMPIKNCIAIYQTQPQKSAHNGVLLQSF